MRPSYLRFLVGVVRFLEQARRADIAGRVPIDETLGDLLARFGTSDEVRTQFVLPLGAALWSTSPRRLLEFPARSFLAFCHNHGMLDIVGAPRWRTLTGGSDSYVRALIPRLAATVHRDAPVARITRERGGVVVALQSGRTHRFDRAIVATRADQALALLGDPTDDERTILGAMKYTPNTAWLHTDMRFLPDAPDARSSWNFRITNDAPSATVTYWMNRLQSIPGPTQYMVTLNPMRPIDPSHVRARVEFAHPFFDVEALRARGEFARIQGAHGVWFCGAYLGYGFHEDGLRSGRDAARDVLDSARSSRGTEAVA
jgi:predicted NAD/FAD-binding protein